MGGCEDDGIALLLAFLPRGGGKGGRLGTYYKFIGTSTVCIFCANIYLDGFETQFYVLYVKVNKIDKKCHLSKAYPN